MRFDPKLDIVSWLRSRSYKKSMIMLLNFLKPTKEDVILDVGAGTGVIASEVSTICDEVFALEPRLDRVEYIKRKFPEVKAFSGAAESIQFPESYFSKIYVVNAFHHFENQDQALSEFARILRPSGLVLIHEMYPSSIMAKIEKRISALNFKTPESLQEEFELAGFHTIRLERTKLEYFVLFQKT